MIFLVLLLGVVSFFFWLWVELINFAKEGRDMAAAGYKRCFLPLQITASLQRLRFNTFGGDLL